MLKRNDLNQVYPLMSDYCFSPSPVNRCPPIPILSHGHTDLVDVSLGATVTYYCDEGYEFAGDNVTSGDVNVVSRDIQCLEGAWTGDIGVCNSESFVL